MPLHTEEASQKLIRDYALQLDKKDQLRRLRDEFIIPSKPDLKRKTLAIPREKSPTLVS